MAKFDIYRVVSAHVNAEYFVDVQSDLLSEIDSRVVIPLVPLANYGPPMSRLNPVFAIEGELHALATADLAGAPNAILGEVVGSLKDHADDIVNAIDFLLFGF